MTTIRLKKSIQSIFIGLMIMTAFPVLASSDNSASGNGDAVLTKEEEDTFRKRTPSRQILQLIYEDGRIYLTSDFFYGGFTLSFKKNNEGATFEIPYIQVEESVPFELEYGEYQVTAVAEDGTVLVGYMQVY